MNLQLAEPLAITAFDGSTKTPKMGNKIAILVCHGMGQQLPFETLSQVVEAIRENLEIAKLRLVVTTIDGKRHALPRAELQIIRKGTPAEVHVYEAYWAPLTEGMISLFQTISLFTWVGIKGTWESLWTSTFRRWLFGLECEFKLNRDTFWKLFAATIALAVLSIILIYGPLFLLNHVSKLASLSWGKHLLIAISAAIGLIVIYFVRKFIVQYFGDVAIYVSSNTLNKFWKTREEIKDLVANIANIVYCCVDPDAREQTFSYKEIIFVGHSLGSVIAYDTLNAIINQDLAVGGKLSATTRSKALLTFGSPLDKTAYMFRNQLQEEMREREILAAAMQPMICNYQWRPDHWTNIYSPFDVISGSLDFYDEPQSEGNAKRAPQQAVNVADLSTGDNKPKRIVNYRDPDAPWWNPVAAHTRYWYRHAFKEKLTAAITGDWNSFSRTSTQ